MSLDYPQMTQSAIPVLCRSNAVCLQQGHPFCDIGNNWNAESLLAVAMPVSDSFSKVGVINDSETALPAQKSAKHSRKRTKNQRETKDQRSIIPSPSRL
jgi:hypothetical protein